MKSIDARIENATNTEAKLRQLLTISYSTTDEVRAIQLEKVMSRSLGPSIKTFDATSLFTRCFQSFITHELDSVLEDYFFVKMTIDNAHYLSFPLDIHIGINAVDQQCLQDKMHSLLHKIALEVQAYFGFMPTKSFANIILNAMLAVAKQRRIVEDVLNELDEKYGQTIPNHERVEIATYLANPFTQTQHPLLKQRIQQAMLYPNNDVAKQVRRQKELFYFACLCGYADLAFAMLNNMSPTEQVFALLQEYDFPVRERIYDGYNHRLIFQTLAAKPHAIVLITQLQKYLFSALDKMDEREISKLQDWNVLPDDYIHDKSKSLVMKTITVDLAKKSGCELAFQVLSSNFVVENNKVLTCYPNLIDMLIYYFIDTREACKFQYPMSDVFITSFLKKLLIENKLDRKFFFAAKKEMCRIDSSPYKTSINHALHQLFDFNQREQGMKKMDLFHLLRGYYNKLKASPEKAFSNLLEYKPSQTSEAFQLLRDFYNTPEVKQMRFDDEFSPNSRKALSKMISDAESSKSNQTSEIFTTLRKKLKSLHAPVNNQTPALPTGVLADWVAPLLPLEDLRELRYASRQTHSVFKRVVFPSLKVKTFIEHVARGRESEACKMLYEDRSLLLKNHVITDSGGRRVNTTAWKYALWQDNAVLLRSFGQSVSSQEEETRESYLDKLAAQSKELDANGLQGVVSFIDETETVNYGRRQGK